MKKNPSADAAELRFRANLKARALVWPSVRRIARHGGRTWAEGKAGEGATFYFTLKPATAV